MFHRFHPRESGGDSDPDLDDDGNGGSDGDRRRPKKKDKMKRLLETLMEVLDSDEDKKDTSRPKLPRKVVPRYKKGSFLQHWISFRKELKSWGSVTEYQLKEYFQQSLHDHHGARRSLDHQRNDAGCLYGSSCSIYCMQIG